MTGQFVVDLTIEWRGYFFLALFYLLPVMLFQLFQILLKGQAPAEQKLPQILQKLYEQQNTILDFFIQLQGQVYNMMVLLLHQQPLLLVKQ